MRPAAVWVQRPRHVGRQRRAPVAGIVAILRCAICASGAIIGPTSVDGRTAMAGRIAAIALQNVRRIVPRAGILREVVKAALPMREHVEMAAGILPEEWVLSLLK